jgi:hypothetical protein
MVVSKEVVDLNLLEQLFPCRLGVNDECILDTMFALRFMPLFMVEHFVVAFNPNGPKHNTM